MRNAVITTLKALYAEKKVTALNSIEYNSTRITNEISTLRNILGVDIITDRVYVTNRKWYGSYRLSRTNENLKKVRNILKQYSNQNEAKKCKN